MANQNDTAHGDGSDMLNANHPYYGLQIAQDLIDCTNEGMRCLTDVLGYTSRRSKISTRHLRSLLLPMAGQLDTALTELNGSLEQLARDERLRRPATGAAGDVT